MHRKFGTKTGCKSPLGKPTHEWKGDNKLDSKNTMRMRELIHLAQNRDQCTALANIERNFRIAQNATKR
jgi:hypothetical protein